MSIKVSQIINELSTNPWLIVLSAIVTILSFLAAIFLYFKAKKVKKPRYAIRSINFLKDSANKIEGLQIMYSSQPVQNVTITKVAFWNDGNETINGNDIANADPIEIRLKEGFMILESKIIYEKNNANLLTIQKAENDTILYIKFDYLDRGEGAVIQLLHTGNSSEDVIISGTIKGVGKVVNNSRNLYGNLFFNNKTIVDRILAEKIIKFITIIMGTIMTLAGIFEPKLLKSVDLNNPKYLNIAIIVSGLIYLLFGVFFLKRRVPKGFEIFEENI